MRKTSANWKRIKDEKKKYQAYLCSREWAELREKVKSRCGNICERCNKNEVDCVHHLTYERKYEEELEDLQGCCNPCHEYIHAKSEFDPAREIELTDVQRFESLSAMSISNAFQIDQFQKRSYIASAFQGIELFPHSINTHFGMKVAFELFTSRQLIEMSRASYIDSLRNQIFGVEETLSTSEKGLIHRNSVSEMIIEDPVGPFEGVQDIRTSISYWWVYTLSCKKPDNLTEIRERLCCHWDYESARRLI